MLGQVFQFLRLAKTHQKTFFFPWCSLVPLVVRIFYLSQEANNMPAPRGNKNALKHGLYARHFTPEQSQDLGKMTWNNLLFEIAASRSMAEKAMSLADRHMCQPDPDSDKVVALIHAWNASVTSIGLLAMRYSLLTGKNAALNDSLAEALSGLPLYEPDPDKPPH
jgi:hypothetical protein